NRWQRRSSERSFTRPSTQRSSDNGTQKEEKHHEQELHLRMPRVGPSLRCRRRRDALLAPHSRRHIRPRVRRAPRRLLRDPPSAPPGTRRLLPPLRLRRSCRRAPRSAAVDPGNGLMAFVSRGFRGRRVAAADPTRVPPGQYVTADFPVLSAGPTPHTSLELWDFTIVGELPEPRRWSWEEFRALPSEEVTRDIHCVTKW